MVTFTRSLQRNYSLSTGFCRAQARKNARSDRSLSAHRRIFLDFLFLLYQDKRKSKNTAGQIVDKAAYYSKPINILDFCFGKRR